MQVRIVSPCIGLAKGMLLKKRGITHIQLPPSMIKAPKSKIWKDNRAAVVIKGIFPSEENTQLGRHMDKDCTAAPSWIKKKDRKPLSKMYRRMLIGYGVKESMVASYSRQSTKSSKLRHSHLKGCTDPTGKLPENKIFISGFVSTSDNKRELFGKVYKKVYVSRSPCLEPGDAKIVSVVGSKPKEMSIEEWRMLCGYDFGTIIFPKPGQDSVPLPCVIAGMETSGCLSIFASYILV